MTQNLEQRLEEHFHLTQRRNWTAMEIQKLEDFIKAEIASAVGEIGIRDIKEHSCLFNDGECNCECYVEAHTTIEKQKKSLLDKLK